MDTIASIDAVQISDSRSRATLRVRVETTQGAAGEFAVPSGASVGSREAQELRTEDTGMSEAIAAVTEQIAPLLRGKEVANQRELDLAMIELDGTTNKSNLGGNAIIGVSIACAKAAAAAQGLEVYEYLRTLAHIEPSRPVPLLYLNYINGGKHAASPIVFQEHMLVPQVATVGEALAMAQDIEAALAHALTKRFGAKVAQSMGLEGGFALPEKDPRLPLELLRDAIAAAGHEGTVRLAIDAAANSFVTEGHYTVSGESYTPAQLGALYRELTKEFALLSIEDPFAEDAYDDFAALQHAVPALVVGDDLTVTNAQMIERAAKHKSIRAVIIKPNQVGTLTETLHAMEEARSRGLELIASHRSGETEDTFIADLAYAFGCFGLKAGTPRRPERKVKYERLRAIADRT